PLHRRRARMQARPQPRTIAPANILLSFLLFSVRGISPLHPTWIRRHLYLFAPPHSPPSKTLILLSMFTPFTPFIALPTLAIPTRPRHTPDPPAFRKGVVYPF